MSDLFSYRDQYPNSPGFKRDGTSRIAAKAMTPRAPTLRERILALLRSGACLTPDEAAARLGEPILAVRPRFSELSRLGLICETGERRQNDSGLRANVYRIGAYDTGESNKLDG